MDPLELKQIEANVVLVATNLMTNTVYVSPIWGCNDPTEVLQEMAAVFGLRCAEQDGCGFVRVEIHDFRNQA